MQAVASISDWARKGREALANEYFNAPVDRAADVIGGGHLELSLAASNSTHHLPVEALGRKPVHDFVSSPSRKSVIFRAAAHGVGVSGNLNLRPGPLGNLRTYLLEHSGGLGCKFRRSLVKVQGEAFGWRWQRGQQCCLVRFQAFCTQWLDRRLTARQRGATIGIPHDSLTALTFRRPDPDLAVPTVLLGQQHDRRMCTAGQKQGCAD